MPAYPGADGRVVPIGSGGAARQALRLVAAGMVAGLLLGATPLRQWTESLPDGMGWANRTAAGWEGMVGRAGLNRPYAGIRGWVRGLAAP